MKQKVSILNIVLIAIGLVVLVYGMMQKSESTVLANEINESVVQASTDKVDPANDGKLIIVSGTISATDEQTDDYFHISQRTIKLKRVVEVYQWIQDCSSECAYLKIWSEPLIDSSKYDNNHKNPDTKQYSTEEYFNEKIHLGDYLLTSKLVNDLHYDTVMGPDEIMTIYDGRYDLLNEYITNTSDMDNPAIGDFRIHYEYVKDKNVTIIAKQIDDTFAPYYTDQKKEIYDIIDGEQTAAEYVASIEKNSSLFGIIMVAIGAIFIFFGVIAIVVDTLKQRKQK